MIINYPKIRAGFYLKVEASLLYFLKYSELKTYKSTNQDIKTLVDENTAYFCIIVFLFTEKLKMDDIPLSML